MRRTLIALLLLASPLLAQAPNGWAPIENGWAEIQTTAPTGTVTTTGTLASGQVALGSGATSITGDAGLTYDAGTDTLTVAGACVVPTLSPAADVLSQKRGTNAQTFRVYGTDDGAGNAEWINLQQDSFYGYRLLVQKSGTGSSGATQGPGIQIQGDQTTNGAEIWLPPSGGEGHLQFAGSSVLNWGASNSFFYPGADNGMDLGKTTNQWKTGYFGTSVVTPLVSGGADSATPNATAINGTNSRGGTDTNVAGGNLTIRPGAGTGSATGSSLIFQTPTAGASGTTGQTQTTRLTVSETGIVPTVPIMASGTLTFGGAGTSVYVDATSLSVSPARKLGYPGYAWGGFYLDYTNTATVGAVTINKPSGRVILATGASSVVVTNSLATSASHVFVTRRTNDTTALFSYLTSTAGSFTIFATAAATADTEFDFFIVGAD